MFRIKTIRNSTVAKQTNISPSINNPTPILIRPPTRNKLIKKNVQVRPIPTNKAEPDKKTTKKIELGLKSKNIAAPKQKAIKNFKVHQEKDEYQGKKIAKVVKLEDMRKKKVEMEEKIQNKIHQSQLIQKKEGNQRQLVSQEIQSINKENVKIHKQPNNFNIIQLANDNEIKQNIEKENINQIQISHKSIDQEQENKKKQERERKRQEGQKKREQQLREEQQRNKKYLIEMEKIQARRKAREQQKQRKKKIQEQRFRAQQAALRSLQGNGGIIHLADPLAHMAMPEAVMDVQIKLILKMNFATFPNRQAIEQQLGQLERINLSYQMIRDDPGHPLMNGLSKYRIELFNRVGELVVAGQRMSENQNFVVIQADHRNQLNLGGKISITKGLTIEQLRQLAGQQTAIEQQDCAICLASITEESRIYNLPCNHKFHPNCLEEWVSTSANCPSCRYNIKYGHA